jgi:glycogen debranching enzyme
MSAHDQPWLHELVTVLSAPTAVLSEAGGQIRPGGAQGALHADCRVLSQAVLEVAGAEPVPIGGGLLGADAALFISVPRGLGDDIADPTVRVEREREVTAGGVGERIRLISTADSPVAADLVLRVAADLAGLGQIKAGQTGHPAVITIAPLGGGQPAGVELTWGCGGLRARLTAPGAGATPGDSGEVVLRWPARLAGRGQREIGWELTIADADAVVIAASAGTASAGTAAGAAPAGSAAEVAPSGEPGDGLWREAGARSPDPRLPSLLRQSLADAAALRMATARAPADVFLAAGSPWFFTLFGRDSIWAARLLLPFGWQLAAGTLRALAAFQGCRVDPVTAEAPGKIPHELRAAGRTGADGHGLPPLYYGTIDATPLWVCLLHDAWRWGMPDDQVRALLPALSAALACVRDHGDADGDGFLEYIDHSGRGLANQGWKDSGDAVRFADGRIAAPPVALCEVQAYAFEAATRGADLLEAFGEPGAAQWRDWAAKLALAFRGSFWTGGEASPYPALALDGDKRPVDSVTSNIGHLLGTGLLSAEEEGLVAARLAAPDMDSGFGLRTMSSASGGYSPLSYHCGSVWSHDTAIVVSGLARSGHAAGAAALANGLLDAAAGFGWRLPELFGGDPRDRVPWPVPYPAACRPQAWAAASVGALAQALLGLSVDVPGRTVRLAPPAPAPGRPVMPLHVTGLVAGQETFSAEIDLAGGAHLTGLSLTRT